MKKLIFILSILSCIILTSCNDLEEITFEGIEQVNISSFTEKGVEAEIVARIKNPNHLSFTIYKSDMEVMLGDIAVGKASLTDKVKIKGNSDDTYNFKIKSNFSNLNFSDLPTILSMAFSKQMNVGIKGNLKMGNFFMRKNIPVNIIQEVPLDSN